MSFIGFGSISAGKCPYPHSFIALAGLVSAVVVALDMVLLELYEAPKLIQAFIRSRGDVGSSLSRLPRENQTSKLIGHTCALVFCNSTRMIPGFTVSVKRHLWSKSPGHFDLTVLGTLSQYVVNEIRCRLQKGSYWVVCIVTIQFATAPIRIQFYAVLALRRAIIVALICQHNFIHQHLWCRLT